MAASQARAPRYWIIKTTAGDDGTPYWDHFRANSVLAVGWNSIGLDPTRYSSEAEFMQAARHFTRGWAAGEIQHGVHTVFTFANTWSCGDVAIVCRGYGPVHPKDVHLFAFAIAGDYRYVDDSPWWRHQRFASLRSIEVDLPRAVFSTSLGLGTSRKTIHSLTPEAFQRFSRAVVRKHPELWRGLSTRTVADFD